MVCVILRIACDYLTDMRHDMNFIDKIKDILFKDVTGEDKLKDMVFPAMFVGM